MPHFPFRLSGLAARVLALRAAAKMTSAETTLPFGLAMASKADSEIPKKGPREDAGDKAGVMVEAPLAIPKIGDEDMDSDPTRVAKSSPFAPPATEKPDEEPLPSFADDDEFDPTRVATSSPHAPRPPIDVSSPAKAEAKPAEAKPAEKALPSLAEETDDSDPTHVATSSPFAPSLPSVAEDTDDSDPTKVAKSSHYAPNATRKPAEAEPKGDEVDVVLEEDRAPPAKFGIRLPPYRIDALKKAPAPPRPAKKPPPPMIPTPLEVTPINAVTSVLARELERSSAPSPPAAEPEPAKPSSPPPPPPDARPVGRPANAFEAAPTVLNIPTPPPFPAPPPVATPIEAPPSPPERPAEVDLAAIAKEADRARAEAHPPVMLTRFAIVFCVLCIAIFVVGLTLFLTMH
jgi:hypothetical protein